jgi:alpha-amylase
VPRSSLRSRPRRPRPHRLRFPALHSQLRRRNGIKADSKVEIKAAEPEMYVAVIDGRVTVKLGPKYDMGGLVPRAEDGWAKAVAGPDFAVWERKA